jgi:hypothetical protein
MTEQVGTFVDWFATIAATAELNIEAQSEEVATISFNMGEGRSQTVWVSPMGDDPAGNTLIAVSSPALKMPGGQQLGQKTANDLLREKSGIFHGAWCIQTVGDDEYLVCQDTQIAQTLDANELSASVHAVAWMADEMEKKLNVDNF